MPFWWTRRKKFWWGRRRRRYKTNRYRRKTRPRRRRFTRRRGRRTYRRRRKHTTKVRRKRKQITIKQWQPDRILTCKIKGSTTLVLGGQGKQLACYTPVKGAWVPPKAPAGGGFGSEVFSLGGLYEQYKFHKNIWTKSNIGLDLCRYLRVKMTFYRHPETDFIVRYQRQPPFELTKLSYTMCHPLNMLLSKHKILILSKSTKPLGKIKRTLIIKPPKQMITKWFFQEHFAHEPLVQIDATAANLNYSNLGCCNTNPISTFFCINTGFYQMANWDANTTTGYQPYTTVPNTLYFWSKDQWNKDTPPTPYTKPQNYANSVQYTTGWFNKSILTSYKVTRDNSKTTFLGMNPTNICRYNPFLDTGKGTSIWLVSNLANTYKKPTVDKTLIHEGYPLYMLLFGFLSFVQQKQKFGDFLTRYVLAIECPTGFYYYSQTGFEKSPIIPLDQTFVNGLAPYKEDLTESMKIQWTPNVYTQLEILNSFVESGPYVPKYSQTKNSTWELDCHYNFLFKWGGPEATEPPITDPQLQGIYEVPDTLQQAVQIRDPSKQTPGSILHPWDLRRGFFTTTALKRMQSNLSTDSSFQPDTETIPRKKKKTIGPELPLPKEADEEVQNCLLSLFEKNTYQDQENKTVQQLIREQQEQQQLIKYNILRVLSDMKEQQNLLKLQTGFLN
nr:MAG: ORF1 [Torque teno midi virus]